MSFLDLRNEVKSVISKQLSNDMKIGKVFMSKHYDFQKLFFGEIVFDDEHDQIRQAPGRISDDDVFNNGKIYTVSNVLNDILNLGETCNALKTWLSSYNKESKLKRNQNSKFYSIFNKGVRNVKLM